MKRLVIILVGMMIVPELALANQVQRRQVRQRTRIQNGSQSGQLTRKEAANLRASERQINREKRQARSDGQVTKEERQQIRQDQNKQSRKIYRKKHNERQREDSSSN